VIEVLVNLPSPSENSSTPFYPEVLQAKWRASTSYSSVIFILNSHLNLLRRLGVCQMDQRLIMNIIKIPFFLIHEK